MRRLFAVVVLLACAVVPSTARAQATEDPVPMLHLPSARPNAAARLHGRPNTAGRRPDSVFVGHSYSNHWSNTNNFWNLYAGTYRPGANDPTNSVWDWDHTTGWGPGTPANLNDSLEGWWPVRRTYYITGGLTLADASRPWWAIDHGNGVNYRLNAGGGRARTKGVIGVWHHDAGVAAGGGVTWTPISGGKSAWCGLRQTGDVSHLDAVTRNAYNAAAAEFVSSYSAMPAASTTTGTAKNFPGYMSAWDQMLYRDVSITAGQPLAVSFQYRMRMSTQRDIAAATCTGIFWGDPLAVTTGNFISATAAGAGVGGNAPIDSFMVFVGVPTDPAACTYSDGVVRPVFDPMRRWFSEVLRVFGAGNAYYELFAATGSTDTLAAAPTVSATLSATQVDALIAAQGGGGAGTARLVFRVKTNKDYADDDTALLGFTSRGWGAAQIDNVVVNGVVVGSFEGAETAGVPGTPNADAPIDNATSTTALQNWKSTGKPPAIYWHPRALAQLRWEDVCGPPGSPTRQCNMQGNVISAGNFDDGESAGDRRFFADRERLDGMVSPTIDLVTDPSGTGETPNPMGITWVDSQAWNIADDYYVFFDLYTGVLNLNFTGNAWTFGAQSYPARQPNGGMCWGELRTPTIQFIEPSARCVSVEVGLYQNGLVRTANADGVADSIRIFLGKNQQCFRFGVSTTCGADDGAYFDNVSMGFINSFSSSSQSALSMDVWNWWQDTFPANELGTLPGTAEFDTTTALVKSGINTAPGALTIPTRYDVPGDTSIVYSPITSSKRIDLVFRILPGPGNYQVAAGRTFPPVASMQLLRLPTNQAQIVTPGDASFWGQYLANPGEFATPGGHYGGTRWDPITWNSARCDTAERNNFPTAGFSTNRGGTQLNQWASMYHEADPRLATLGMTKFRCFRMDTAVAATQLNIRCDGTVPAWLTTVPVTRTGWDGSMTTKEFTKIIPDGLLTPGSHVQYFYRHCYTATPTVFTMVPDTNSIVPQSGDGSRDGFRWQSLSVLPDRWKEASFGGQGMACMLVVDQADRLGEERMLISIADSVGLTSASRYGAHNGWHAAGTDDIWNPPYLTSPPYFVHGRNSQPGTSFDLYNVKGAESFTTPGGGIGNRLANRTPGTLLDGKWARTGPTPGMLRTYYRMLLVLTGQVPNALGPVLNRSSDDIALLQDFLAGTGGTSQPRALWVIGGNFMEGELATANTPQSHATFVRDWLGADLVARSFQGHTAFMGSNVDLVVTSTLNPGGTIWGHNVNCALPADDVLAASSTVPEAFVAATFGSTPPVGASVFKPASAERPWASMVDAFRLQDLTSRFGDNGRSRMLYVYNALSVAFAGMNCLAGEPFVGVPGSSPKAYLDAVALFGNPLRAGTTNIRLSLAARDRALVRLYDVGGRVVRTLADRTFEAGEHDLRWDGTDDQGRRLPRGVYFAQVRYPARGFEDAKKIVLVK